MAPTMFIFNLVLVTLTVTSVCVSGDKVERGQSCDNTALFKLHPKFKASRDKLRTCDEDKGFSCIPSENPEFRQEGQSNDMANIVCDCTEDFYFDPVSRECRIQIGFACDPENSNSEDRKWKDKCPENAYCSTNLGHYGPKGAKGMCRCKEGFFVSSIWFVNGGGSVCEKQMEMRQRMMMSQDEGDYGFQETNSLMINN